MNILITQFDWLNKQSTRNLLSTLLVFSVYCSHVLHSVFINFLSRKYNYLLKINISMSGPTIRSHNQIALLIM